MGYYSWVTGPYNSFSSYKVEEWAKLNAHAYQDQVIGTEFDSHYVLSANGVIMPFLLRYFIGMASPS